MLLRHTKVESFMAFSDFADHLGWKGPWGMNKFIRVFIIELHSTSLYFHLIPSDLFAGQPLLIEVIPLPLRQDLSQFVVLGIQGREVHVQRAASPD